MLIGVRWETTYQYSDPVRLLHTELRVLPVHGFGQRLVSGSIHLEPESRPFALNDAFGNRYHHVDFLQEVDRLHVAVEAEVETSEEMQEEKRLSPLLRYLYVQPTERSPFAPPIAALNGEVGGSSSPRALGEELLGMFSERFVFEVGTTDVAATATDLLEIGSGVCQDFSHLMLSILRQRDIPARYVSGYLAPRAGEELAEASHAWVQLHDGEGWWGFDPANACLQDDRYVVTAVGRDYDDVPPLRGTYHGVASEEWSTSIRLRSTEDEPAR